MSTSTIQSLKFAKPAIVQIIFDKKELNFNEANTGEYISSLEISSSFTRPVLMAIVKIQKLAVEKLKLDDINKQFNKSTVKITITQKDSKHSFTKRFIVDEVVNPTVNSSQGGDYIFKCLDVYGYSICNDIFQYKDGLYEGTPINNVISYINNIFSSIKEKYKDDTPITINHLSSYEYPVDSLPESYKKEVQNLSKIQIINASPLVTLREYCTKYNIRIWQDYNGLNIVQNPKLSKFPKFGYYLSDRCESNSPYYICDYKIMPNIANGNTGLSKTLKRVSVTEGKNNTVKQLDTNMLLESLCINDNSESYTKYLPTEASDTQGNSNTTNCSLTFEEFYRALATKTLYVCLCGNMGELYPGKLVDLNMIYNHEDQYKQYQGDIEISKTWFITGSTYKVILGNDGKCFCRLILNRFDDPKDITSKEDTSIYKSIQHRANSDISLTGLFDDIEASFKNAINDLKNSVSSLKNILTSIKGQMKNWALGNVSDLLNNIKEIKENLKNFDEIVNKAKEEAKQAKIRYNNSTYGKDFVSSIDSEFGGLDLDGLFSSYYEDLENMGLSDRLNEFKVIFDLSNKDLSDFQLSVKKLFDSYNYNNINIKSLDNAFTSISTHSDSDDSSDSDDKTKSELNNIREKQLQKIREKQGIPKTYTV